MQLHTLFAHNVSESTARNSAGHVDRFEIHTGSYLWAQSSVGNPTSKRPKRPISYWNNLPRESGGSSTLGTSDSAGQGARASFLDRAFARQAWTKWSVGSFPTWYSMILSQDGDILHHHQSKGRKRKDWDIHRNTEKTHSWYRVSVPYLQRQGAFGSGIAKDTNLKIIFGIEDARHR